MWSGGMWERKGSVEWNQEASPVDVCPCADFCPASFLLKDDLIWLTHHFYGLVWVSSFFSRHRLVKFQSYSVPCEIQMLFGEFELGQFKYRYIPCKLSFVWASLYSKFYFQISCSDKYIYVASRSEYLGWGLSQKLDVWLFSNTLFLWNGCLRTFAL